MTQLNVPNLDKLIAHLEAQPPERINMAYGTVGEHKCGTCGCILGHAAVALPVTFHYAPSAAMFGAGVGLTYEQAHALTHPSGWQDEEDGARRYPAHRVIATLKRLRDRFLATGEIVVDWGPEPTEGQPRSAPQAVELSPPALPAEITRLLAPVAVTEEAR